MLNTLIGMTSLDLSEMVIPPHSDSVHELHEHLSDISPESIYRAHRLPHHLGGDHAAVMYWASLFTSMED